MWVLWVVLGLVALVAVFGLVPPHRFVSQRQLTKDAWANIDTELRRRYDLIPNLVETVRGYASHERAVFENVTKARGGAPRAPQHPPHPEARLQTPRRFFNANVRDYNERVGQFPSMLVARAFGFRVEEFFE